MHLCMRLSSTRPSRHRSTSASGPWILRAQLATAPPDARRDADDGREDAGEMTLIGEARCDCDFGEGQPSGLDQGLGRLDAPMKQPLMRRETDRFAKGAREVADG